MPKFLFILDCSLCNNGSYYDIVTASCQACTIISSMCTTCWINASSVLECLTCSISYRDPLSPSRIILIIKIYLFL
jgi:hypothetical protein